MIPRPKPERFRLRRTMLFMNAQKPGLIKDAYIYGCDSIMLDLEDAVAENQKDAARFSLYHALTTIDYGSTEVIVRINGLDTPHWQEDIRVCVAGGADEREQGFVILTAVNGRFPQPQKVQVRAVDDQKFHDSASLMVFRVSSSAPSLETVTSANCAYSGFRRA